MLVATVLFCLFPLLMIFAAVSDILTMTIPNRVSLLLIAGFAAMAPAGLSVGTIGLHVLIAAACLAVTFGFFAAGWMGGGDAKLFAAAALWFGPSELLVQFVLLSAVYGGVLTLGLLSLRRMLPVCGIGFLDRLLHHETGIPYGIALGAAGLTVYASSFWMDAALAAML